MGKCKTKILAFLLVLLLLTGCTSLPPKEASNTVVKLEPSMITTENGLSKLGTDIAFIIGGGNLTLITSKGDAALVDTGYSENNARIIRDYLDENKLSLKYIILTHLHSDHTGNLATFKNEAVQLLMPTNVEDGDTIILGDKILKLLHTPGHTAKNAHISIELPKENVLIAGDILITDCIPALGGNANDLENTLNMLKAKEYDVIIPGHGGIVDSQTAIVRNIEYLTKAKGLVEELIKKGGTASDLKNIKLENCVSDVSYINPNNIQQLHMFALNNLYNQMKYNR